MNRTWIHLSAAAVLLLALGATAELGQPAGQHKGSVGRASTRNPKAGRRSQSNPLSITTMSKLTLAAAGPNSYFGRSVASAGDVNGDGYDDVIVGAFQRGEAYIYFGGPAMDSVPDIILRRPGGFFGFCVSGAGDVNGDGYADVIVGDATTHAYVYLGGAAMDTLPAVTINDFGYSVSSAGDVNGDGYDDVIVGAQGSPGGASIYFGGATMDNVADVSIPGNSYLGYSVSSAGDVNGDGYPDVIVGAPGDPPDGRAYIYYGGPSMNNVPDVILPGPAADVNFGESVCGAGDVNGDGYSDVIVGAGDSYHPGFAFVYFGGPSMDTTAAVVITDPAGIDDFGECVSGVGDVNGDGYDDVIVGADGGPYAPGHAYVYYGGSPMDTTADVVLTSQTAGSDFGYWVGNAGDVDGDGRPDIVVGAPDGYYAPHAGNAYVYISAIPLPIQLSSFTATVLPGGDVRLDWVTMSEVNNYGFEIQRKRVTEPVYGLVPNSFVPGHGTTNEPHSYAWVDSTVTTGDWLYRLKILDLDNSVRYSEPVSVSIVTGVARQDAPREFVLRQNFPNPFNPATTIEYTLPRNSFVFLTVFDMTGRQVAQLVREQQEEGSHSVVFDAQGLSSGVYFYSLQAGNFRAVRKLLLIR